MAKKKSSDGHVIPWQEGKKQFYSGYGWLYEWEFVEKTDKAFENYFKNNALRYRTMGVVDSIKNIDSFRTPSLRTK